MKTQKILRMWILLAVMFGLVACQSGGEMNADSNSQPPEPTATKVPALWPSPTPTLYTYLNVLKPDQRREPQLSLDLQPP